ncbi:coiled-coil domain-containing protein 66 isoform X2 [Paramormyrops kingsleyae]|uniref:coiled-coil domain-containing protein 66 isoform X2 n=1 Tax=Paramormyrops kingsleyae TaxID=1676925 RepID=UPI000CD65648|nr:coiled-coil domain-containing protein 66 isoform X2 [Paramormyrops kingsleyae]
MNLGDGLMFELENGKAKLVLSSQGLESRNAKKVIPITRLEKVPVRLKQTYNKPVTGKPQRVQERLTDVRKRIDSQSVVARSEQQEAPKPPCRASLKDTGGDRKASPRTGAPARSWPLKKSGMDKQVTVQKRSEAARETLKNSLVCLTQQQLEQILSSINQATDGGSQSPGCSSQPQSVQRGEVKEGVSGTEKSDTFSEPTSAHTDKSDMAMENAKDDSEGYVLLSRVIPNGFPAGLFSTLGEREREKDVLEAKREQWKKELDEQMALKRQKKVTPDVALNCGTVTGDHLTKAEEERILGESHERKLQQSRASVSVCCSQKDLPAAIRSAFVLGEATPVEHAFSAKKREDRRMWLQELDQQREEARLRKMQERQNQAQGEDLERWAMHFDSLQKRAPSQLPPATEGRDSGSPSARYTARPLSPPSTSSLAWEGTSTIAGDHLGWVSVDSSTGGGQRSNHLRTMTALLDPAQIEERERKRVKQLEHQRAIAAQVEERRRQREQEEALWRAEEQEEERRVAQERERLEQQYQLDSLQQRHKEELQALKAEELYLTVQRAQEEALRARQRQRIQELTRKGHDVSKLLRQLQVASDSADALSCRDSCSLTQNEEGPYAELQSGASPRRDTAVQTDADSASMGLAVATPAAAPTADGGPVEIPDAPVEQKPLPSTKKLKQEGQVLGRNPRKGKENENMRVADSREDPYEGFARTGRDHRRQGWNTQRPGKPFVPASERYPPGPRQRREESRLRRQAELLALVGQCATARLAHKEPPTAQLSHRQRPFTQKKEGRPQKGTSAGHVENSAQPAPLTAPDSTERPSSSSFVPYVRTDEVYHLDPLAPISRPSTQELQHHVPLGINHSKPTSNPLRDPLLNPELLKNKERQQAILKGLSELRQGLLLKQRELETALSPLLLRPEGMMSPTSQHV